MLTSWSTSEMFDCALI